MTGTTETYNGAELTVFTDPKVADEQAAFAIVDGKVAIVGRRRVGEGRGRHQGQ